MSITAQMAKHLREVYLGKNWTASTLKDHLDDLSWEEAITPIYGLNTIAILTYHLNYYVTEVTKVLQGGPLESKDEHSFNHPRIQNQSDWDQLVLKLWSDVEIFAALIEELPDDQLLEDFTAAKYGNYYRNLQGIIEHVHYHLGQIVIIKKIIRAQ